eukprot:gnl/Carplike_NY0171/2907_a3908_468.p1 GENE.gnl/Carplike_NY0171/2907_a3908_468~~gnl/Carplike_NY0171/2907_a3908_468.p1  ORF type:complete len:882 (+),score=172.77 gnl/Carplike_NY0171/2907_a3908_468:78-2723(+)
MPPTDVSKLWVGPLPSDYCEKDIIDIFSKYGHCTVSFIKDKEGKKRGSCFVHFTDPTIADTVLKTTKGKVNIPELRQPLRLRPALDTKSENSGFKLFIGMIPLSVDEEQLRTLFQRFGSILDVAILRDSVGVSKASGFVKFFDREGSERAISNLHNTYAFPESTHPLVVRTAYTREERDGVRRKKKMKQQSHQTKSYHPQYTTILPKIYDTIHSMGYGGHPAYPHVTAQYHPAHPNPIPHMNPSLMMGHPHVIPPLGVGDISTQPGDPRSGIPFGMHPDSRAYPTHEIPFQPSGTGYPRDHPHQMHSMQVLHDQYPPTHDLQRSPSLTSSMSSASSERLPIMSRMGPQLSSHPAHASTGMGYTHPSTSSYMSGPSQHMGPMMGSHPSNIDMSHPSSRSGSASGSLTNSSPSTHHGSSPSSTPPVCDTGNPPVGQYASRSASFSRSHSYSMSPSVSSSRHSASPSRGGYIDGIIAPMTSQGPVPHVIGASSLSIEQGHEDLIHETTIIDSHPLETLNNTSAPNVTVSSQQHPRGHSHSFPGEPQTTSSDSSTSSSGSSLPPAMPFTFPLPPVPRAHPDIPSHENGLQNEYGAPLLRFEPGSSVSHSSFHAPPPIFPSQGQPPSQFHYGIHHHPAHLPRNPSDYHSDAHGQSYSVYPSHGANGRIQHQQPQSKSGMMALRIPPTPDMFLMPLDKTSVKQTKYHQIDMELVRKPLTREGDYSSSYDGRSSESAHLSNNRSITSTEHFDLIQSKQPSSTQVIQKRSKSQHTDRPRISLPHHEDKPVVPSSSNSSSSSIIFAKKDDTITLDSDKGLQQNNNSQQHHDISPKTAQELVSSVSFDVKVQHGLPLFPGKALESSEDHPSSCDVPTSPCIIKLNSGEESL